MVVIKNKQNVLQRKYTFNLYIACETSLINIIFGPNSIRSMRMKSNRVYNKLLYSKSVLYCDTQKRFQRAQKTQFCTIYMLWEYIYIYIYITKNDAIENVFMRLLQLRHTILAMLWNQNFVSFSLLLCWYTESFTLMKSSWNLNNTSRGTDVKWILN